MWRRFLTALCSGTGTKTQAGTGLLPRRRPGLFLGDMCGNDDDLVVGFVDLLPAERLTPPLGLGMDIEAVDDDRVPPKCHGLTIPTESGGRHLNSASRSVASSPLLTIPTESEGRHLNSASRSVASSPPTFESQLGVVDERLALHALRCCCFTVIASSSRWHVPLWGDSQAARVYAIDHSPSSGISCFRFTPEPGTNIMREAPSPTPTAVALPHCKRNAIPLLPW